MVSSIETSISNCAKKCCENVECIGFDWEVNANRCYLTKTTWSDAALTNSTEYIACQRKGILYILRILLI